MTPNKTDCRSGVSQATQKDTDSQVLIHEPDIDLRTWAASGGSAKFQCIESTPKSDWKQEGVT